MLFERKKFNFILACGNEPAISTENFINEYFDFSFFFFACANRCSLMKIAYLFVKVDEVREKLVQTRLKVFILLIMTKYWSNLVIDTRF